MASKLSTIFPFPIKPTFFQLNLTSFTILSSTLHTSNHPNIHRSNPDYAFQEIKNLEDAQTMFQKMLQNKRMPPITVFNKLLNVLVKLNHFSEAAKLFKELGFLGCRVNDFTLNIVMNCYCKLKEVDLGFVVLGSLIRRGFDPDSVSISCLLKGLFLKENVDEAVRLFKKVLRNGVCEVNEYMVSIVMDGLCKSGNVVDAVKLLEILEKGGVQLNVVVYNAIIDGLCKNGMVLEAEKVLFHMIDREIQPDVVTYTSFIHRLCNQEKLVDAWGILNDHLPSKMISPDVVAYTVMIQGLCREGLFQKVKQMLDKMERLGCFPNSVTYNIIIQFCLKHHDRSYCIGLFDEIVGRDFQLNAHTYLLSLRKLECAYHDVMRRSLKEKFLSSAN